LAVKILVAAKKEGHLCSNALSALRLNVEGDETPFAGWQEAFNGLLSVF
jgi:hypothetical protein